MDWDILGLSDDLVVAYRMLVGVDVMTPAQAALAMGVEESVALLRLQMLEARGMASHRLGDEDAYVAVRPSVALGAMLASQQNQMRLAEVVLGELEDTYAAARHGRSPADLVDVVLGPEAVRARLQQIQTGAREEVLALVKAPVAVLGSADNTAEDDAVDRGVSYRAVLERSMLEEEPRLYRELARVQARGEQMRIAASVPLKLFVIDRRVALVSLGVEPTPVEGALLVRRSGLLDALVALFEMVWRDASEVLPAGPGESVTVGGVPGIDEIDLQILSLLLAGLTDRSTANALRTSVRTVQRRVRAMMDLAGVDTRMQLGWAAAERGWGRPPASP